MDADTAELLWLVIRELDVAERKWHHDNPPPKDVTRPASGAGDA